MLQDLRFALYAIKKNIQSSAELRGSFLLNIFGMAINNISFIILWIFFVKSVGIIGNWTAADIVGLQGFVAISFGMIFSLGAGIRKLPDYVSSGAFERFMLSPKNLFIRIATSYLNPSGVGDLIFGLTCLIIYGFLIHISAYQFLFIIIMVVFSVIINFASATVIYSTSFFFIDSHAVTTSLFELFMTPSLFHGGAFQGMMRFIFIFVIPSLLVGTLPVETVKNISLTQLVLVGTLAVIWGMISIKIFNIAIKKYEGSNFMTFGS